MKIISPSTAAQTVTFLPEEILQSILDHCRRGKTHQALQKDLANFCLVARSWYAAGLKHLYHIPLLTPRNFDKFALTICSPTMQRSRRVGLVSLIHHIDMGMICYESTASTTSRLLSRTKGSLKTFVAPTVSFSTSCLAPLSKCVKLQHLDLSHDTYDFDFSALIRTLSQLQSVTWLSLPKRILAMYEEPIENVSSTIWSEKLESLQINETVPDMAFQTRPGLLLTSFPQSLRKLTIQDVMQYGEMTMWMDSKVKLHQVEEVIVSVRACEDQWLLTRMLSTYPNVRKATVPAMTTWIMKEFNYLVANGIWSVTPITGEPRFRPPQELEILILEASPDYPASDHIRLSMLETIISSCPRLLRLEVPSAYLCLDDIEGEESDLDDLNKRIAERARAVKDIKTGLKFEDCGVFAGESVSQGVGLKRSIRPRNDGP